MLYAFINPDVDYTKLAYSTAISIKYHLKNNNVTLITDRDSINWIKTIIKEDDINSVFDNIIIQERLTDNNKRVLYDSPWTKINTDFKNGNRYSAYDLSPYDETIVLDVDYLIMSNNLDNVWNNNEDFLINKSAVNLRNQKFGENEQNLSNSGIPMYWATIIYFKKTKRAKVLFDLVQYIKENYMFYKHIYKFPNTRFRNDYAFSIAVHILDGFEVKDHSFPIDTIITMDMKDDIVEINKNDILFLSYDVKEPWINILVRLKSTDVHIMNKLAMNRHFESICTNFKG